MLGDLSGTGGGGGDGRIVAEACGDLHGGGSGRRDIGGNGRAGGGGGDDDDDGDGDDVDGDDDDDDGDGDNDDSDEEGKAPIGETGELVKGDDDVSDDRAPAQA